MQTYQKVAEVLRVCSQTRKDLEGPLEQAEASKAKLDAIDTELQSQVQVRVLTLGH